MNIPIRQTWNLLAGSPWPRWVCALAVILALAGCQQPSSAGSPRPTSAGAPQPQPGPQAERYRVLFDASHAQTAGNADWIISTSMPDPLGENANPRAETDWSGALSAWGVALQQTGRYQLRTLPGGSSITYDAGGALDLSNFDVFVVPEPNERFTNAEKAAIVSFVRDGGGLFMIANHDGSDRNRDGADPVQIWNDLMDDNGVASNPFGFRFDVDDIARDDPRNIPATAADDPVIRGPFGIARGSIIRGGTTATLDQRANASVRGLVYRTAAEAGGTDGAFFLTSAFGAGRVAAWGDSSPADDGTGAPQDELYDGWNDAGGSNAILALNATEWLAQGGQNAAPADVASTAAAGPTLADGAELLLNGDFERGLDGWQSSGGAQASSEAHGGGQSVKLCGANNCAATLAQRIDIPAGARGIALGYSVLISTEETSHAYDFLDVELRDQNGETLETIQRLSDAEADRDWRQTNFDLAGYAGQSVELVFTATSGRVHPTTFFVDDVHVIAQF